MRLDRWLARVTVALAVTSCGSAVWVASTRSPVSTNATLRPAVATGAIDAPTPAPTPADPGPVPVPVPVTTAPPAATSAVAVDIPKGPVRQAGCPPPPSSGGGGRPPWHPAVLVPDDALPAPAPPPTTKVTGVSMLEGKGMWIWQWDKTDGGSAAAVVARAAGAGLHTLWVRVGDTRSGFYGGDVLAGLVPAAHARGISVVAWGFPHLYDPMVDAAWSAEVLAWRGPGGERVDAFSPDLELPTEGVAVTTKRLAVYLGAVRATATGRPLVATVYPPTESRRATYPYATVGAYSDATAPMEYWGCREPGQAAIEAVQGLAAFGPVLPIGQAYDMASDGGRHGAPSRAETLRFLDVAHRSGALGVTFWDWQEANAEQWGALTAYPWSSSGAP